MLPEEQLHFRSDQEMLQYFINQLDMKYRIVLVLSYFNHMKIKEIANTLEIPEGTVKSRMSTGKEQLKELIVEYQEIEQTQLNFKTVELSTVLTAFFAEEFSRMMIKIPSLPYSSSPSFLHSSSLINIATAGLCTVLAGTCAYASYQAYQAYDKQKQANAQVLNVNTLKEEEAFGPITYQGKVFDNPEDAFYELTLWAHCEVEMQKKSQEERQAIQPLYEELKKQKGTYWKLMQFRGWNEQFEKNNKKVSMYRTIAICKTSD